MTDALKTIREALEPFAAIYEVVRHNPDPVYQGDVCRRSVSSLDFKGAYEALSLLHTLEQTGFCNECNGTGQSNKTDTERSDHNDHYFLPCGACLGSGKEQAALNTGVNEYCDKCGGADKSCTYAHIPMQAAPTDGAREDALESMPDIVGTPESNALKRSTERLLRWYDTHYRTICAALKTPTPPAEARNEARKAALSVRTELVVKNESGCQIVERCAVVPRLQPQPEAVSWKEAIISGFPWDRSDESLKRSFACQEAGLLDLVETEEDSFDREEYGETMFILTKEGEAALTAKGEKTGRTTMSIAQLTEPRNKGVRSEKENQG